MIKVFKFKALFKAPNWISPAFVTIDSAGNIKTITDNLKSLHAKIDATFSIEEVDGYFMPGFYNAHSHSFQYAMAGLSEYQSKNSQQSNFWSWREQMYRLALEISPEKLEATAAILYSEMLKNGIVHVVEFHYLHHDKCGSAYADKAEMSARLFAAAKSAGIGITLIPIFYQNGGFNQSASPEQKRFICRTFDEYALLVEAVKKHSNHQSDSYYALGVHSLRAVGKNEIKLTFESMQKNIAKHIHIAEQINEVKECEQFYKARPVQWFFNNINTDQYTNFVHATHLDQAELKLLSQSQASVVLCPSTEANLGDGFFPFLNHLKLKGNWSIGTDSNISLSPLEDLRWLEYGERLKLQIRNPLCHKNDIESGEILFTQALSGGRQSAGLQKNSILETGVPLDGFIINANTPLFYHRPLNKIISTLIFAADHSHFIGTMKKGKWIVKDGKHLHFDQLFNQFKKYHSNI